MSDGIEAPEEVLLDLDLRFIISAPKESLSSPEHLAFLVEHCYWYYEDHIREKHPEYKHFGSMQTFARYFWDKSPILRQQPLTIDEFLERWRKYKRLIPVYGAIIMDAPMERVLLVRGMKNGSGWGWPQGKVNQGEDPITCAEREVYEETGIDIQGKIVEAHNIKVTNDGKPYCLYIVTGIDPDSCLVGAKTKGEIGAISWHYLADLPSTIEEANQVYLSSTGERHKFYLVQPFVKKLREWIRRGGQAAPEGGSVEPRSAKKSRKQKLQEEALSSASLAVETPLEDEEASDRPVGGSLLWSDFWFNRSKIMRHFDSSILSSSG